MPTFFDELDETAKRFLSVYPVRAPVKWRMERGVAVLIYRKNFSTLEERLHSLIGGPDHIRRPLDEMGTEIWLLCDGQHDLAEICTVMDDRHKERIEPVFKRVWAFVEMLLQLHLLMLSEEPTDTPPGPGGGKKLSSRQKSSKPLSPRVKE